MGYINPLLDLPAGRRLRALPPEQRRAIEQVMRELRDQANVEAENAWRRRKGPMAAYWRAVATYARHTAHALSQPAICGRVSNGYACDLPAGSNCPDCGLALHDVPEGS
jgi:hypothetical protein